ncbi:UDP-N-acetylglucosamine--dolichyl-phosphate N-acetylglucosaminephosphotransferase-like [Homarus americanus]|uniref:UDP-N-acetylglucosamine--dolichyl-phosphate N-acetylglucosaminephosphotransferase-like n=1 Tax=Homarus americanus TaxID=6706 RepID=UPI001C45B53C|nr:UDP-N-acetylglucosamine--dolichyl-phosphate N-acetylglucosaminephosphotransferase-like [Homarus americanus]
MLVRPKLDYGCEVYYSANEARLKTPNSIHHVGVHLATGGFRSSPIPSLLVDADDPLLDPQRQHLQVQCWFCLHRLLQSVTNTCVVDETMSPHYTWHPGLPQPLGCKSLLTDFVFLTGPLYYVYMSMLAVFCTNAINIYAGINGLESGQAVVIGASVAMFSLIELGGYQAESHYFSLCIIIPFVSTSIGLYYYNRYPARAFVGDTFTYFAGMTFAVVAIIGHFSKTVLLFFLPQIFNFLYSVPQLFHFVPCPRHRLPRYNAEVDKLEPSVAEFKAKEIKKPILVFLRLLTTVGLVNFQEGLGEDGEMCCLNNLTLINLTLLKLGPQHEGTLTTRLLMLQVLCSGLAFFIRYPLADMFF